MCTCVCVCGGGLQVRMFAYTAAVAIVTEKKKLALSMSSGCVNVESDITKLPVSKKVTRCLLAVIHKRSPCFFHFQS